MSIKDTLLLEFIRGAVLFCGFYGWKEIVFALSDNFLSIFLVQKQRGDSFFKLSLISPLDAKELPIQVQASLEGDGSGTGTSAWVWTRSE